MMEEHPSTQWEVLGDVYYEKTEVYEMEWQDKVVLYI